MKKLLLLLLLSPAILSLAQPLPVLWTNTYKPQGKNADRASCITTDSQGNILVAGYAGREFAYPDAFVIKYSPAGDTLWTYYHAGSIYEDDGALDITTDAGDNVYISGYVTNANYADECFTAKLNASGVEQWANRYAGPAGSDSRGNAVAVDDSGNVYVAGYYDAPSASKSLLVIKYNPNGTVQWTDVSNAPSSTSDEANDLAISPNGNATVCGMNTGTGTSYNLFVKQYARGGGMAWYDSYTNPSNTGIDEGVSLAFTSTGELRVGGNSYCGSVEDANILALSYSPAGIRQWATIYTDATTPGDELATGMALDTAGNVFLTALNFQNQAIFRINANGSLGWKRIWRGPVTNGTDVAFDVAVDASGSVYVAGKGIYPGPNYFGNNGLDEFTVAKYSAAGDSLWTYKQSSNTDVSIGFAIHIKDSKVYAAGFKADTAYVDENFYTVILDTSGAVLDEWTYSGIGDAIMRGQFVKTDAMNNVVVAGTCDRLSGNTYDVAIVKYDAAGNVLWHKVYSSYKWRNDTLTGMVIDPSGNIFLSVSSDTGGTKSNYQLSVVKYSTDGEGLDTGYYASANNQFASGMVLRDDGSVVLGTNGGVSGAALICFDSLLTVQWVAQVDSAAPFSVAVAGLSKFSDDDLAVACTRDSSGFTTRRILVQRIDASGTRLWSTEVDSVNIRDEARDVAVSANGDVAVAGLTGSVALAVKLDGNTGAITWKTIYNPTTSSSEAGKKIRFTPAGSVAMLCDGFNGFVYRWYTVQFNGISGIQEWATPYSAVASDRFPVDMLVQSNGTVVTAGYQITGGTIPNYDYVLVGYSTAGVQRFLNTYSTAGIYPDRLWSLTVDSLGNFIVTGESSNSFLNDYRYFTATIKYGPAPVGLEELVPEAHPKECSCFPTLPSSGKFTYTNDKPVKEIRILDSKGSLDPGID
jgi:uncharacterized delta-60 repeat protein